MDKGYNISVFEKGALIIRCCAAYVPATITEYDDGDGIVADRRVVTASVVHNDLRTEPVRLVAVENGVIYLEPAQTSPVMRMLGHTAVHVYKLIHEYWQDGWMPFEVPEGLTPEQSAKLSINNCSMEKTIQPAIKVEVSIDEMANWFWMMSVEDKVKFFNSISEQEDDWFGTEPIGRRQLGRVANHPDLSASAKEIIKCLK